MEYCILTTIIIWMIIFEECRKYFMYNFLWFDFSYAIICTEHYFKSKKCKIEKQCLCKPLIMVTLIKRI